VTILAGFDLCACIISCLSDADYIAFLESTSKEQEALPSAEAQLERREAAAAASGTKIIIRCDFYSGEKPTIAPTVLDSPGLTPPMIITPHIEPIP